MGEHRRLLAEYLLDSRDRLIDGPLGADALGHDAVDCLRPDALRLRHLVPPLARDRRVAVVAVAAGPGQELQGRDHPVRVARVEPERMR
jgi:hypothetical protein